VYRKKNNIPVKERKYRGKEKTKEIKRVRFKHYNLFGDFFAYYYA
jgi:hypothetical protein